MARALELHGPGTVSARMHVVGRTRWSGAFSRLALASLVACEAAFVGAAASLALCCRDHGAFAPLGIFFTSPWDRVRTIVGAFVGLLLGAVVAWIPALARDLRAAFFASGGTALAMATALMAADYVVGPSWFQQLSLLVAIVIYATSYLALRR